METLKEKHFIFAGYSLDVSKRLLLRDGVPVTLHAKAFELLVALIERRGDVLNKDELLEIVWPGQFVEEGNLTVQISTLRKVFGESKNEHRFIVTVPGRGYSFVAEVNNSSQLVVENHRRSTIVIEETDESADDTRPSLPGRERANRRTALVTGLILVTIAVGGLGYWRLSSSAGAGTTIKSIAVMPFVNESGNADLEYLSDGLTESLIGNLSQLPAISVKARSSVSRYRGVTIDVKEMGSGLSVDAILTGRLVQRADKMALYVELIEPSSEHVLWKADYHRAMGDLAALQTDIARDVANRLRAKLSGAEDSRLEKYQTHNSEAYELYLKGVYFLNQRTDIETKIKAIECFESAIRLDPEYALAYVGVARAYMRLGSVFGLRSPQETFPKAREALLKAISLNSELAEAHGALGEYYLKYEWNWPAAERELKQAVALDPDNPEYHTELGSYYQSIGSFEDAIRSRETARKLDPTIPGVVANVGYPYYYARRQDQAIEWYKKALELNPKYAWSYLWSGQSYLDLRKYTEAIVDLEKGVDLSERNARAVATLGHAYAKAGRSGDAKRVMEELRTRSKTEYVSPYFFAVIYAGMGDADKAFEYLEQARMERQTYLFLFKVEPVFDDLRSDPRHAELVTKIGIPK